MTSPDGKHSLLKWPDLHRRFLTDAWRAMNDWLNEPFFGELDRWFSDCSSPWFQPRIEVVDDGKTLRITAQQPGMNWKTSKRPSRQGHRSSAARTSPPRADAG
jgi:HSP20 family protein